MTTQIDVPAWIHSDHFDADVLSDPSHEDHAEMVSYLQDICQGGCASGAYMPAVTYHQALATMNEYGDEVLPYIEGNYGEIPTAPEATSWAGLACHYLSFAVELWAHGALAELDPEW